MILRCEVCREKIARFDETTIHAPLTADQFRPIAEGKSHHPPFRDDMKFWTCPICKKRPFNTPKRLYTDAGYVDVPEMVQDEPEEAVVSKDDDESVVKENPYLEQAYKDKLNAIPEPTTFPKYMCPICGQNCGSSIGLASHKRHKHK